MADFKRASILREAARQFYTKGYDGTRIDEIASVLGVTKPFIYYHFKNKTELLDEICVRATAVSGEALEMVAEQNHEIGVELREAIRLLALQVIENRADIAICFREEKYISPEARLRLEANRRRYDAALSDILKRAGREGLISIGDPQVATQVLTGAITWSFVWYREGGRLQPEDVAEQVLDLAAAMLNAGKLSA
ncbi:MAG: TetR/AcrR family transcriptional regulator [Candidatus Andeanibacterium colombiense]|uniref:TetR/AcrR family transcriptional regulator n=1 Tax=Candidatus Andeanibacterium colombiense TaxID=3121345 RepID=A0AAJ5X266_9SPHN|nr:MAG: TetR/AcrR family transcriptional regulator [Sphingomonadaceae bacterium]